MRIALPLACLMLAACGALVSSGDDAPDERSGGGGGDGPDASAWADGGWRPDGPVADGGADASLDARCKAALFCETFEAPSTEGWTRSPVNGGVWSEALTSAAPRSPPHSLLLTPIDGGADPVVFASSKTFGPTLPLRFSASVRVNDLQTRLGFFAVRATGGARLRLYFATGQAGLAREDDSSAGMPFSAPSITTFHEWTIALSEGNGGPFVQLMLDGEERATAQLDGSFVGPFAV